MKNLICFFLFLSVVGCKDASEDESSSLKIDSLENEIRELKIANDTLSEHLLKKSYLARDYPSYFDTIPEPEVYILNDLQQQPDLIPKDAVMGGTMRFTRVMFINEELLVAEYEDGHVMGKAVYTYEMDKNGDLIYDLVGSIR